MKIFNKRLLALFLALMMVFSLSACVTELDSEGSQRGTSSYTDSITDCESQQDGTNQADENDTSNSETQKPTQSTTQPPSQNSVGTGVASAVDPSTLPAYSGNAFTYVNSNQPNFSAAELTTEAYEKYSSRDSLGRCGVAIASCGKEIMPGPNEERGSISNVKPTGWVQKSYSGISGGYLWNRCHLIGWQLSAENANRENLITGTRYMNISGMLKFENMVADYIKETSNHVAYRITPIFEGNNLVCSGVQMEAYSIEDNGDGICFNVYCYNVQPGITINYDTGDSSGPSKEETSKPSLEQNDSNNNEDTNTEMVWIPKTGSKYHNKASCSNMKNPSHVSKQVAIQRGYEPCKKCY